MLDGQVQRIRVSARYQRPASATLAADGCMTGDCCVVNFGLIAFCWALIRFERIERRRRNVRARYHRNSAAILAAKRVRDAATENPATRAAKSGHPLAFHQIRTARVVAGNMTRRHQQPAAASLGASGSFTGNGVVVRAGDFIDAATAGQRERHRRSRERAREVKRHPELRFDRIAAAVGGDLIAWHMALTLLWRASPMRERQIKRADAAWHHNRQMNGPGKRKPPRVPRTTPKPKRKRTGLPPDPVIAAERQEIAEENRRARLWIAEQLAPPREPYVPPRVQSHRYKHEAHPDLIPARRHAPADTFRAGSLLAAHTPDWLKE